MRRHARKAGGRQLEVEIASLGGRGDGVALVEGRPVFLPLAAVGDRMRIRLVAEKAGGWRGEPLELLAPGPDRVEAPCPHFGPCGGCLLQHLNPAAYRAWKRSLLSEALARQGLAGPEVLPLIEVPPGTRRRVSFSAVRRGGRVALGFNRRFSHEVVPLETCLLLTPGLTALLAPLGALLRGLLAEGGRAELVVNETESGPDLLLLMPGPLALSAREGLADFAAAQDLARLSWAAEAGLTPEPVVERRAPRLTFGGIAVVPPPGAFLQASLAGESLIREAIESFLPAGRPRVLELFSGIGSFTFPLAARSASLLAVESDEAALAALWTAARHGGLAGPLRAERRDLDRRPFRAEELRSFDLILLDPPRAGAERQAREIAASRVPRVIMVSCHPTSFARDARILTEGGFALRQLRPLDQFPWSPHLELVALFER